MNGVINTVQELLDLLATPNVKHLFIVKGKEIYLYESNAEIKWERLELFNEPEVQEGAWRGHFMWALALIQEIGDLLPIVPMSGDLDSDVIRAMIPDLLEGNLTQKQIRDMLGITDASNAKVAAEKNDKFDDYLKELQDDEDDY